MRARLRGHVLGAVPVATRRGTCGRACRCASHVCAFGFDSALAAPARPISAQSGRVGSYPLQSSITRVTSAQAGRNSGGRPCTSTAKRPFDSAIASSNGSAPAMLVVR